MAAEDTSKNPGGGTADAGGGTNPAGGEDLESSSAYGVVATHPDRDTQPLLVAPTTSEEKNTLELDIIPVACLSLHDILFAFDSSFITPDVQVMLRKLPGLRQAKRNQKGELPPLSIFGHADPVGDDDYNKKLSGRRVRAVYGLLTRNVGMWEEIANSPQGADNWGNKDITDMMQRTVSVNAPAGSAAKMSKRELMAAYMDAICPFKLEKTDFLAQGADADGKGDYQGCSEFNLTVVLSDAENKSLAIPRRNAANRPNRRVVIYLFRGGTKVRAKLWPCPTSKEGIAGCRARFFSDGDDRRAAGPERRLFALSHDTFACRFYQRIAQTSPCEGMQPILWIARWDRPLVRDGETGNMILEGPDLAGGETVTFEVTQEGYGVIGQTQATAGPAKATAPWNDWFHPKRVTQHVTLETGQDFPIVKFTFVAKVDTTSTPAIAPLVYEDFIHAKVKYEFDRNKTADAKQRTYTLFSPWGSRGGQTAQDGSFKEERLPPGGASVVLGNHRLINPKETK